MTQSSRRGFAFSPSHRRIACIDHSFLAQPLHQVALATMCSCHRADMQHFDHGRPLVTDKRRFLQSR